jgi:ubiquinone/menaquinone biosynthesis C-methylase UbiE
MDGGKVDIVCPACKKGRLAGPDGADEESSCARCKASFPKRNGVIDLIREPPGRRKISQALMEWRPLIKIYESGYWRKSSLFARRTGIKFDDEYNKVATALNLSGNEVLLDLACGPGIYSRPFARLLKSGHVVGLDLSAPMLDYAASKARAEGIKNLTLIRGSALDLPFPDEQFDAANCCGAVHLFPDPQKAIDEVGRVLKPGASFTAAVFGRPPGERAERIAAWRVRNFGVNSFLPEEIEKFFTNAGLHQAKILHHKEGWAWLVMSGVKPEWAA